MECAVDHSQKRSRCLIGAVAEALQAEPALEAVKIDRAKGAISVATLGLVRDPEQSRRLKGEIERLSKQAGADQCDLLRGKSDCAGCALAQEGLPWQVTVKTTPDSTTIARETCPTSPTFWSWKSFPLPRVAPREVHLPHDHDHQDEWKLQLLAAAACGLLGLAAWWVQGAWALPLFCLSYLAGAWFAAEEVWERLQERVVDIHFLMLAVAAGSASVGAWGEGAVLLFLFSFSGALEHYALGRTQREINSLFKTAPKMAVLIENGVEQPIEVEAIAQGMRLLIKPGDLFPVDAEIVRGQTASDEANLTGEATPVDKTIGDTVLAGTINLWGVVEVSVLRPAKESSLQRIIRLIQDAQHVRAPSQRFTDRFGTGYTYGVLTLSLVMFFVWWLLFGHPAFASTPADRSAFYRAMTLLVVASPCALVLSIPSAILAAIAFAARRGILFRGGAAVEKLAQIQVVAMDKTGTLTTGELQVSSVESFPPGHEVEILRLAYSMEKFSTHPLARAITRHGKKQEINPLPLSDFESVSGLGLKARLNQQEVLLGRREWLATNASNVVPGQETPIQPGFSEVWVAGIGVAGRILLRDDLRPQASEVIDALRRKGIRTLVLTGDRQATAYRLKEELRVDEIRAELKPQEKVDAIAELVGQGRKVAMIGDGVNDAPSLAAADVGVAMGARGSDSALEQADIVLMHDRLENFLAAFELSKRARSIIVQNLTISLGTVIILVAFALLGKIPLTLGVVGHEGSTVVVVINALRLLVGRRAV